METQTESQFTDRLVNTVGEGGKNSESDIEAFTLPCAKWTASGHSLYDAGNPNLVFWDHLDGWDGVYVYLWLVHGDIWQKLTQCCKEIILQLKTQKK